MLMVVGEPFAPRVVWPAYGEPGSTTDVGDVVLARSASLFGRARHEDGSPAVGSRLSLYRTHRMHVSDFTEVASWRPDTWFHGRETVLEEDGAFRFDSLAPGEYAFVSLAGEWTVEPGRTTGPVELLLPAGRSVRDEVALSGTVRNLAGDPLPGAFVTAFASEGAALGRYLAGDLVESNGSFVLRLPANLGVSLRVVDFHGRHHDHEIALAAPAGVEALDIVLEPRLDHLPPIDGMVLGPDGQILAGARVILRPPEDSLCSCISFQATTDEEGTFRFQVSDGLHRLAASHSRFATAEHYPARPGDFVQIVLGEP
jgi:hypothetical protein